VAGFQQERFYPFLVLEAARSEPIAKFILPSGFPTKWFPGDLGYHTLDFPRAQIERRWKTGGPQPEGGCSFFPQLFGAPSHVPWTMNEQAQ